MYPFSQCWADTQRRCLWGGKWLMPLARWPFVGWPRAWLHLHEKDMQSLLAHSHTRARPHTRIPQTHTLALGNPHACHYLAGSAEPSRSPARIGPLTLRSRIHYHYLNEALCKVHYNYGFFSVGLSANDGHFGSLPLLPELPELPVPLLLGLRQESQ